jgi:GntR family transcriptional regulator, histidine utilization repressor
MTHPHSHLELNGPDPAPLYRQIKRMISQRILSGDLPTDGRIPSEMELVRELGVSRMTVHRALRELTEEGMLIRVPGVGTFVAPAKPQSALLELRTIAEEVRGRQRRYSCDVHLLRQESVAATLAGRLGLRLGSAVFHSICIHCEDGVPVQLEDRFVNPAAAPDFLNQDYSRITANEYLTRVAPATEAEHVVESILPDKETQHLLRIGPHEPCLLLVRTTWSEAVPVTYVRLTHPGSKRCLGGRFAVRRST